ncbi:MAG: sulfite exporter TauE/SafE family protein [Anaerolineales bacterium]
MELVLVPAAAFIGYVVSTVGGGGGSLLLVPVLSFALGARAVAPVLAIGEELSRPARLIIFWRDINWSVAKFHIPGAMLGAFLGAYVFTQIKLEWLQIAVGLYLISTIFQYRFGEKKRTFEMKGIHFLPLGFVVSLMSAIIGATGQWKTRFT